MRGLRGIVGIAAQRILYYEKDQSGNYKIAGRKILM
jgi:hypothetical protein